MTAIGLISDVHATPSPIAEALSIFEQAGVGQIFCAGDIAGYGDQIEQSISLLVDSGCQIILGNHDLRYLDNYAHEVDNHAIAFFRQLGTSMSTTIGGIRLHMVHGQPPDNCHNGIKLLDGEGKVQSDQIGFWSEHLKDLSCDVLVVGHTHQVFAERVGDVLIVNPGSTLFNHSCAILDLPEMTVQVHALSDGEIKRTWSYSDYISGRA